MQIENRTAFVTGASRGLGRAIALALRGMGARVIGTRTSGLCTADEVCDEWLTADFSQLDQIRACAARLREAAPDILINNAGINKIAPFADIDPQQFLVIQQVNVFAPLVLCQAAIPAMKARHWGRIVNISSVFGQVGKEFRAAYSASKFALDGMTLALAAEHTVDGILANCVAPGFIDTELTHRVLGEAGIATVVKQVPIRRMAQPEEVARLVVWLASDENTYVAGQNIAIDGGFSRV